MIDPIYEAIVDVHIGLGRKQGVSDGYEALIERGVLDLIARVRQAQLDALASLLERQGIGLTEKIIAEFDADTKGVCDAKWHVRQQLRYLCLPAHRKHSVLDCAD